VDSMKPWAVKTTGGDGCQLELWARRWFVGGGTIGRGTKRALGIFPGGPWARRPRAGLTEWAGTALMGQTHLPFSNCSKIFQFPNRSKLANYEKCLSRAPKFSKPGMVVDKLKRNIFRCGNEFRFVNYKL
jgi:hypothetical protein